MTNDELIPECRNGSLPRGENFGLRSCVIHSSFSAAFTIIELLIVMAIIIVLAGLILATAGYVSKKGQRSRAEAEIAAISAALENYKADNGVYPRGNADAGTTTPVDTDQLNAKSDPDPNATPIPNKYTKASRFLYEMLSADANGNGSIESTEIAKVYFPFKPQMMSGTKDAQGNFTYISFIRDPFGNSYGYSTAFQNNPNNGYNPTFDLWSTAGETAAGSEAKWIKNW